MSIKTLQRSLKPDLAYYLTPPAKHNDNMPFVVFCSGFRSDMQGTKAIFLENICRERGQGYVRFDYSGHGVSGGVFRNLTISDWKDDVLDIIDHVAVGDVLLIGSSMGGWLALLAALERTERVKGLIGIAAAPDFTREIRDEKVTDEQRKMLDIQGYFEEPNSYSDEPYVFTKALLDDGEAHCLLDRVIGIDVPVRLLQGMKDEAVPWQKAHRIKKALENPDNAEVFLIEQGDHSLSQPEDLELLAAQLVDLSGCIENTT